MNTAEVINSFLWLMGFILVAIFYVAVVLIADRTGKIVKLLRELRDQGRSER